MSYLKEVEKGHVPVQQRVSNRDSGPEAISADSS